MRLTIILIALLGAWSAVWAQSTTDSFDPWFTAPQDRPFNQLVPLKDYSLERQQRRTRSIDRNQDQDARIRDLERRDYLESFERPTFRDTTADTW